MVFSIMLVVNLELLSVGSYENSDRSKPSEKKWFHIKCMHSTMYKCPGASPFPPARSYKMSILSSRGVLTLTSVCCFMKSQGSCPHRIKVETSLVSKCAGVYTFLEHGIKLLSTLGKGEEGERAEEGRRKEEGGGEREVREEGEGGWERWERRDGGKRMFW